MKKNTFIYFLSLTFCLMIAACSNKTSVKFFGVPLGERADDAQAYFEKTREKVDFECTTEGKLQNIVLHNKKFYNVTFDSIALVFIGKKLHHISLSKEAIHEFEDDYNTSDIEAINSAYTTLVKSLEKDYGKAHNITEGHWEKGFIGNGVNILVKHKTKTNHNSFSFLNLEYYSTICRLTVEIRREQK